jgi:hypothetical protein
MDVDDSMVVAPEIAIADAIPLEDRAGPLDKVTDVAPAIALASEIPLDEIVGPESTATDVEAATVVSPDSAPTLDIPEAVMTGPFVTVTDPLNIVFPDDGATVIKSLLPSLIAKTLAEASLRMWKESPVFSTNDNLESPPAPLVTVTVAVLLATSVFSAMSTLSDEDWMANDFVPEEMAPPTAMDSATAMVVTPDIAKALEIPEELSTGPLVTVKEPFRTKLPVTGEIVNNSFALPSTNVSLSCDASLTMLNDTPPFSIRLI